MGPAARKPHPHPRAADVGAPDSLLVRRLTSAGWLRGLPAPPRPGSVTVSLTHPTAAIRHAAELAARGYRPVGAVGGADGDTDWADFLVPRPLAAAERGWVRALAGPDGRVYDPTMGPVRTVLAEVLEAHRGNRAG